MSRTDNAFQAVEDPRHHIDDFEVSCSPIGWRAVHKSNPAIVVEATDWDRLDLYCAAQRISLRLQQEARELASWGRWDHDEPAAGGGGEGAGDGQV